MHRTIEIADFDLPLGPISIERLMAMPRDDWSNLRIEINRRRRQDSTRPLARCRLCKGPVFIRSHFQGGKYSPVYAHYPESPADCPWYHGGNLTPDDARAAQYKGHQESALHRWMCETIAELIGKDQRCSLVTVGAYRRPSIETRGRYPDVYAELGDLGKFAIEVQLSKPFAPEIAARNIHYEVEGVALIWVFRQLDEQLPQGFYDVITLQRGNAFLFDNPAFNASRDRGALVLSAILENGRGGFLKPRLVTLDELDCSSGRAVFLEDRRSKRICDYCRAGRVKWFEAFAEAPPTRFTDPFSRDCFRPAWDSIRAFVPTLGPWKEQLWTDRNERGDRHFCELAAILFSIASSSNNNSNRVYVTSCSGPGALLAMLNIKLKTREFMPYATLIKTMLLSTSTSDLLARASLARSLEEAREKAEQICPGHPVWSGVTRLFPEVFDGLVRGELEDLGKLPPWARGVAGHQ